MFVELHIEIAWLLCPEMPQMDKTLHINENGVLAHLPITDTRKCQKKEYFINRISNEFE